MAVLYTNNAVSALSASITNTATSFSVAAGKGALFPALSGADYFYATLVDSAGNIEIVKVTARVTDTFTVVRGQDGTTGLAFSAGDKVELRLTRAALDDIKTDTKASLSSSNVTTALGYTPINPGTSQTANYVWAAPNGTAGAPTFRAIVAADIPTLNQNTTGSAAKWTTARTLSFTGDATGSGSVDGSANVATALTLANTAVVAGSYGSSTQIPSITVDSKGRITAASNNSITVGNGTLTVSGGTGLSGSGTFTANQSTNATITLTNADRGSSQAIFKNVAVSGQSTIVADTNNDTLTIAAGSNVTLTTDAATDTLTIASVNTTYSAASTTNLGLIKLEDDTVQSTAANAVTTTASRTYGLQVNSSGQGVVNVPWTDTVYTLPAATSTVRGGIELGSDTAQTVAANAVTSTASRTYALQVNGDGQGVVNVPWTDTVYTLPSATTTVLGGVKLGSDTAQTVAANAVTATASRSYAVQVNASGQAVVNVPWTDTNSGGTVTSVATSGAITGGTITTTGTISHLTSDGYLHVPATGTTNNGKVLTAGATAGSLSWQTPTTGTVTSVSGTGTVSGLTLTGTVTTTGNLTLGGTLSVTPSNFASQTANTVLAAPNGAAGTPTFRALVAADVPTLNQNTTGTASNVTGTVAVANGGTGATTASAALTNLGAYAASNPNGYTSNTGTVTSIVAGTGLSGGTITTSGTIALANTAVTAGSYTLASITVDAQGRITAASNGTAAGATISNDTTTAATYYPTFATATSGTLSTVKVSSTKLTYNPSTGALTSTSVSASSDESLKTNWRPMSADFLSLLSMVKCGTYDRLDIPGVTQDGVSAQSLQNVLPNSVVTAGEDGKLAVNYGNAALVAAIELAKEVVSLRAEIEKLKSMVQK